MIDLWQTEWCPASRRVRQRLTELDVTYVIHQVPVEKADRTALIAATGADSVPALVDNGLAVVGEGAIRDYLDRHVAEPVGAEAHLMKARKAHRREMHEAAAELLAGVSPSPDTSTEVPR